MFSFFKEEKEVNTQGLFTNPKSSDSCIIPRTRFQNSRQSFKQKKAMSIIIFVYFYCWLEHPQIFFTRC